MNSNINCVLSIFVIIFIYAFIAAAMLKFDFKGNYRTWNRKDKFVSIGLISIFIVVMLLKACRIENSLTAGNVLAVQWNQLLLRVFNGDAPMVYSAVFIATVIPTVVIASAAMDTLGKMYHSFSLPLYFYVLLFGINSKFYSAFLSDIVTGIIILLITMMCFGGIKCLEQGRTKSRIGLLVLMAVEVLLLVILNQGADFAAIVFYIILCIENVLVAFIINRTCILRKIWWRLICLLSYVGLFLLHLYIA